MRLLSAIVIVALFVFLAGATFTWWTPDSTGIGWAYLVAAILIVLDLILPALTVRYQATRTTTVVQTPPAA